MASFNLSNSQTYDQFFQPVLELLQQCSARRLCRQLPDAQWIQLGVCRTLLEPTSGRGFLQQHRPWFRQAPSLGHFFETLKSPRRLALCRQLNALLCPQVCQRQSDPLPRIAELEDYEVYAGDGHWHGAAAHDKARETRKYAVGHFYTLNLRSHALSHLDLADEQQRKHEHDMRALKRASLEQLRQQAPAGRKVLYAWDSACIDYQQWDTWKRQAGIYFITRAKANMAYELLEERALDTTHPGNPGVLSDQLIQPKEGGRLRCIQCVDPASGTRHTFLTNELKLPAGLLAHIYRLRWDLEKGFDQFKNSLQEHKAWASSPTAKSMQATFLCMAHNLMLLMEAQLEQAFGVRNQAEIQRRQRRLAELKQAAAKAGREVSPVYEWVQRLTKRSLKFIRWLRLYFFVKAPLGQAAAYLRSLYATL